MREFDLVVIGTGVAAGTVALGCAAQGWSVAIVDERPYGGTCQLRGCDPKKMLRRAPEVLDAANRMTERGVAPGGIALDWPGMQRHKRSFTDPVPAEREQSFTKAGIATFHGQARFVATDQIQIDGQRLQGRQIVIAAGMKPRPLEIPGAHLATLSDGFLELERLPPRVLFIGGGYISMEFAHMAARGHAKVTVLNRGARPLTGFDADLVDMLLDRSQGIGIDLVANAEVSAIERVGAGLRVTANVAGRASEFEADLVVHGAGRVAAIDDLDLETAGVRTTQGGVEVDSHLRSTSNPMVHAAGDVAATKGLPLTPVAALEGKTLLHNLLNDQKTEPDYRGIPSAVFTIPALAMVGATEAEAERQGLDVTVKFSDMRDWYSVRRVRETHAAAKVLIDRASDRIVGAHVLGPDSVELINYFALAIRADLPPACLRDFVTAYPSAAADLAALL